MFRLSLWFTANDDNRNTFSLSTHQEPNSRPLNKLRVYGRELAMFSLTTPPRHPLHPLATIFAYAAIRLLPAQPPIPQIPDSPLTPYPIPTHARALRKLLSSRPTYHRTTPTIYET